MSFNSGPWLQDVKLLDVIRGTPLQGVETSELNSGPHLECVKNFELTIQPERQGMKVPGRPVLSQDGTKVLNLLFH